MLSCVQRDGSIGLKQRRRDFSREQVAEYNTRAVWNAVRWVYFGGNEFDFISPDEQLATGPAEVCGCLSRSGNDDTLRNQAEVHRERAVAPRYPGRLSHHAANVSSNGSSGYGWFEQPFRP